MALFKTHARGQKYRDIEQVREMNEGVKEREMPCKVEKNRRTGLLLVERMIGLKVLRA